MDSQEVVRRLKEATVYIKNKIGDKTFSTGTGFVIEVLGDTALIATNRHVALPMKISEIPAKLRPKDSKPSLEVVIRSGLGTQNEQALPAEIVATRPLFR